MKLFITNKPSFYKNELFNRINQKEKIVVIFTSRNPFKSNRNADFIAGEKDFECYFLNPDNSVFARIREILGIYTKYSFREVVFSGWDEKEQIISMFLTPRKQNALICESSVFESKTTGLTGLIKRIILSRVHKVYCPGQANQELLEKLKFKGPIIKTGGCGILNYVEQPAFEPRTEVKNFLYVGRLIPVKNLQLLVKVFNELPDLNLTIIGEGDQEEELKSIAHDNIKFLGYVNNADLPAYYWSHDVFVLPSKSEPWGLVVEEALNNGLPVIVSDHVGCNSDLVVESTGLVFKNGDLSSLFLAITELLNVAFYNSLRYGVSRLNFIERADNQVNILV